VHQRLVETLESARMPVATVLGEPKMSDRGLRPTLGTRGLAASGKLMMHLLAYADATHTLEDIADIIGVSQGELSQVAEQLAAHGLLRFE
jgi:aminopeptidase-like protein